jgi:hypothetical protein
MLRAPVVIGASALVLVVGAPDRPSGRALQEDLERALAMPTRMPTVAAEPARMVGLLAECGDAKGRYVSDQARKNYGGTSPITRASGKDEDGRGPVLVQ